MVYVISRLLGPRLNALTYVDAAATYVVILRVHVASRAFSPVTKLEDELKGCVRPIGGPIIQRTLSMVYVSTVHSSNPSRM